MSNPQDSLRAEVVRAAALALEAAVPVATPLIAAVSGGADSVALAHALASHKERWPLLAVAFIDHGLRDVSAERAAAQAAASDAQVPFVERRVEVAARNLQASARRARYQALIAIAREAGEATLVATGHTLSDQAETVLSRLLRGAGLPGLAGLAPRRGRLVRPLLGVSRVSTRGLGLAFVDDPGNATTRFQRNRLRTLLEQLGAEQPRVESALGLLAEAARGSTRLLDAVALAVPDVKLAALDEATTQTLLVHLARAHGARGPQRRAMRAWAKALTAGGLDAMSLGEGLRGVARAGRASLVPDEDPRRMVVAGQPGTYRGPAMELTITETAHDAHTTLPEGEVVVALADVLWPLRLAPARRDQAGAFGDEVDLTTGAPLGGWRVADASGRTLVPKPEAAPLRSPEAPDGTAETRWIRIVLKPLKAARDTRVVGSSKGPLHRE